MLGVCLNTVLDVIILKRLFVGFYRPDFVLAWNYMHIFKYVTVLQYRQGSNNSFHFPLLWQKVKKHLDMDEDKRNPILYEINKILSYNYYFGSSILPVNVPTPSTLWHSVAL